MPERKTLERAAEDKREGKAPSTQAGEFVREEMEHVREGKHGARSAKQAIAIGLSKARRAGVALKPPAKGKAPAKTRRSAKLATAAGKRKAAVSPRRSRATTERAEARRQQCRQPDRAVAACEGGGQETRPGGAFGRGPEGGAHPHSQDLTATAGLTARDRALSVAIRKRPATDRRAPACAGARPAR